MRRYPLGENSGMAQKGGKVIGLETWVLRKCEPARLLLDHQQPVSWMGQSWVLEIEWGG